MIVPTHIQGPKGPPKETKDMKPTDKCRGCGARRLINAIGLCKRCNREAHKFISEAEMARIKAEQEAAAAAAKAAAAEAAAAKEAAKAAEAAGEEGAEGEEKKEEEGAEKKGDKKSDKKEEKK
jgi:hypothetical protein